MATHVPLFRYNHSLTSSGFSLLLSVSRAGLRGCRGYSHAENKRDENRIFQKGTKAHLSGVNVHWQGRVNAHYRLLVCGQELPWFLALQRVRGPGGEAGGAADGWGSGGAQGSPQREGAELLERSGDEGEFGGPEKRPLHQS